MKNPLSNGILSAVPRVTKYVAMLMLAIWGLATVHCDLEWVPGLEFIAWCHPADSAPHQDNSCESDACSVVESGLYRIEEQPPAVTAPLMLVSFVLPLWEVSPPATVPRLEPLNSSPPELPRVWQFFYRTALPPRAPSLFA